MKVFVKPAPAHPHHPAQYGDRIGLHLLPDEAEPQFDSLAKKAVVYSTDQRNTLTDNNLERWCVWYKWDDLGSLLPRRQIFGVDGNTVSH
jgi:hypothetical protein